MPKVEKCGPFHVIDTYYKHGESDLTTYATKKELIKAANTWFNNMTDRIISLDNEVDLVLNELSDMFNQNEENIDIDNLVLNMIKIGTIVRENQLGWGWTYVIEGGREIIQK